MPRKEVHGLNVRDFTYVLANLRPEDEEELSALLPPSATRADFPAYLGQPAFEGNGYTVHLDNEPIAAFGVSRGGSHATAVIWAFGTRRFKKAIPILSHFTWNKIAHDLYNGGCLRLECRALSKNTVVRNWLKKVGFKEECPLPYYGTSGQSFHQYAMTVDDYNRKFSRRLS